MSLARTPESEATLLQGAALRQKYIWTDRFVFYPEASATFQQLDALLARPASHRPKSLLLTAHTNNGKTSLLQEYVARYQPDPNLLGDAALFPVIYFQAPEDGQPRSLYIDILQRLGGVFSPRSSTATLKGLTLNLLRTCRVRMLVVDEIHNLLALSSRSATRVQMLNLLRYIANDLRIPLVFAGIETAVQIAEADEQLRNRFEHRHLPLWTQPNRVRKLLLALEADLPLKTRSDLSSDELVEWVIDRTGGLIGEICELLRMAATKAVGGSEEISLTAMQRSGYLGPERRLSRLR